MRRALLAVTVVTGLARIAHADAVLSAPGGEDLSEGACQLAIELRGLVADVEVRQTFVNPADSDAEAIYAFDLPSVAVVDRLAVTTPGRAEVTGFGVDAVAAITPAEQDDARTRVADTAVLRVVDHLPGDPTTGTPDLTRYELRIYPVPAHKATTVRTHLVVPLELEDGRITLRLPGRGDGANLSREIGEVRSRPIGGIEGYDRVHVDGDALVAAHDAMKFTHARRGPLVLDAEPRVTSADPVAWYDVAVIDAGHRVAAVSVYAPRRPSKDELPFDRVLVVVDSSRSMEGAVESAAGVIDAVLADARPETEVAALAFDRGARTIASWHVDDPDTRARIVQAIRQTTLGNGTALADAMSAAGAALDDGGKRTLVLIVTDGITARDTTAVELAQRLGGARPGVTASVVLVAPEHAVLPDPAHGPLADLANRTGGMVLTLHAGEADTRGREIAVELGHPAPIHDAALVGIEGAMLPAILPAASAATVVSWLTGAAPKRISLDATRGERKVEVSVQRAAQPDLAALAVGAAEPEAVLGQRDVDHEPTRDQVETATEQLTQARRRLGVVTDTTSLVVLDPRSPFAAERRTIALGGGPFTRIEPAPEVGDGHRARIAVAPQVRSGHARIAGELDKRLLQDMLETGLVPRARVCFQPLLLKQKQAEGEVVLDLELSRGELTSARVARSDFGSDLSVCLIDAAYQLDVPRTLLDDVPDTVYVVHYPLRFRSLAAQEVVLPGDADSDDPIDTGVHVDDADQPLGDVPAP